MKTLKNFEFRAPVSRTGASYDWATLLDGKIRQLTEGEDYSCKAATFCTLLRNHAKKAGVSVRTTKVEGGLVIQAVPNTNGDATHDEAE